MHVSPYELMYLGILEVIIRPPCATGAAPGPGSSCGSICLAYSSPLPARLDTWATRVGST